MPGHKLHIESGAQPLYLLKQVTSGLSVYDVELFYDVQDWRGWQVPETVIYEDEKMVLDQKNRFLNESRYAAFVNSVAAPLKPTASTLHARFNKNLVFVDSKQSLERQFATFVHAYCVNHIERTTSVRGENSDRVAFFMTFLIGRHYGIDEAWIEETDFRFLDPNVAYATLTVAYNLFLGLLPKLPG
ncbi:hypothetical protein GCM10008938_37750 [Deinococcus roseus]|uniref:Uncharacterized protein n=2 Tax=Deinococcus roseus TaxID=392414 RepID=A0ABQ2D6V6_9DEIO|nr:hypothetical protein GCM10008938_37750 [Deinococcus roseus]